MEVLQRNLERVSVWIGMGLYEVAKKSELH